MSFKYSQLVLQARELFLKALARSAVILSGFPSCRLLGQERFRERLILLSAVQRLRHGFDLRIERHQNTQIGLLLARKHASITSLKRRLFPVLFVELRLCLLKLSFEELIGALGTLLSKSEIFIHQHRID